MTGGAGFIGSSIVDGLLAEGYEVGILDDFSTGETANIPTGTPKAPKVHRGDIRDEALVKSVVKDYDAVVHQAAIVSVRRSVEDPFLVNAVNVGGTLNLLDAAARSKVERFLYASSSSVYGETETVPIREDVSTSPISPYAVSKLAAENYCRAFAKVHGLKTASLRYFNVYGPRQKYGVYSGVVPKFVASALKGERPVIYGDGEQTRDFVFVQDAVLANLLCLEKDVHAGEVFNVGGGTQTTVNRLAEIILDLVGKPDLRPEHSPLRPEDLRHSYADISRATRTLGYVPRFSIEEGLRRVVEWFLAHPAALAA